MTEVPAAIPVTTPLELITAILGVALAQVPPLVVLFKAVVKLIQTANVPEIGLTAGKGLTIIFVVVALQFVIVFVKVKVAFPEETPVTSPEFVTVAFAVALLIHVPPTAGDNCIVFSTQTALGPETVGKAFTVMIVFTVLAQLFASVTV